MHLHQSESQQEKKTREKQRKEWKVGLDIREGSRADLKEAWDP